jgi:hypothetical protein
MSEHGTERTIAEANRNGKARPGRPSLSGPGERSPLIAVRLPEPLRDQVTARAWSEGKSVSAVMRGLLERYAVAPLSPDPDATFVTVFDRSHIPSGGYSLPGSFSPNLMSWHATREARRERISMEMIRLTYEDPDSVRRSEQDELREIRTRWFAEEGVEVVVDIYDGRVVTVWRKGAKP